MMSVSGVLRNTLTQAVPKPRSTGTGETRIAASTTPKTSAMTPAAPVSLRINRNDDRYTARLAGSEKTCTGHLQRPAGACTGPGGPVSLAAGEFAGVQRRRR